MVSSSARRRREDVIEGAGAASQGCRPSRIQRKREAYHGSVPRADSTRHGPASAWRAFMLAMPWPRSRRDRRLGRDAVPLSRITSWKSPSGSRSSPKQCERAAVLDDVAGGLAQDARGLHVGARRQRLRRCPRSGASHSASMPACARREHHLGAPVAQRVGQAHRLAGEPRTDSRISSSASRRQREMRSLVAGVHDGQQLGAEVVVQVGGDALALALVPLDRSSAAAGSSSRSRRGLAHALLEPGALPISGLLQQQAAPCCSTSGADGAGTRRGSARSGCSQPRCPLPAPSPASATASGRHAQPRPERSRRASWPVQQQPRRAASTSMAKHQVPALVVTGYSRSTPAASRHRRAHHALRRSAQVSARGAPRRRSRNCTAASVSEGQHRRRAGTRRWRCQRQAAQPSWRIERASPRHQPK